MSVGVFLGALFWGSIDVLGVVLQCFVVRISMRRLVFCCAW